MFLVLLCRGRCWGGGGDGCGSDGGGGGGCSGGGGGEGGCGGGVRACLCRHGLCHLMSM